MRIDHTHKKWLVASLIILGVATAVYVPYALHSPAGPSGGSAIGVTFGIIGSAFMVFAGLWPGENNSPSGKSAARRHGCEGTYGSAC